MSQLVRYEQARTALAAVHSYDEVKEIMDAAERAAVYAKQANDTELIQYATEIRVRAQRRAGEMLAVTEKSAGGRPIENQSSAPTGSVPTLADLGVTKTQSSNWQALASMTEEHFEATVATAKDTAGEVTTAFMLREARAVKPKGKPLKGAKADAMRQELKEAKARGISMLCVYARQTLKAIEAQDEFTQEEQELLATVAAAIQKLQTKSECFHEV